MRILIIVSLIVCLFQTPVARADSAKEFTTSVIYGTLAGTLVGAATLAFTSNPGDNLNNVARGASYGLYAGILLGLYVAYGIGDEEEEIETENGPGNLDPNIPAPEGSGPPIDNQDSFRKHESSSLRVAVYPILPQDSREGWGVGVSLLNIKF